ncbi:MAG: LA2681 family HEPN domain-containing protein [Erysipelotrichaceae bacterium]|nr:LA2681 family HEPN domain-containing protein [Erysipelotrichaceae bacterium]
MNRIKLTKEKLLEILESSNNKETIEFYYEAALNDNVEADQYLSLIVFLFILVKYYYKELFIKNEVNMIDFFGMKKINESSEYWKYYELLKKTNLMVLYGLINNEKIPDQSLIEFNDIYSLYLLCIGDYLRCLKNINNSLFRDKKNWISNFIKASIIEICYINVINFDYKIALLNYQKELIDKCSYVSPNFDISVYKKVLESINLREESLNIKEKNIKLTPLKDSFEKTKEIISEWTEEKDFYFRNNLFLNPLNLFGNFYEASFENFKNLDIDDKNKKMFDEIIEDYKFCRNVMFLYYKKDDNVDKRKMSIVYSYLYSIFDKIAYLLKNVYDLDIKEDRIYFTNKGLFDRKFKNSDIKFKELSNFTILPLYLIMKEVRVANETNNALEIGTFEHNELRNTIDHKSIYLVDGDKLKRNALILLERARNAILYTFMLLYSQPNNQNLEGISFIYTTLFCALENK